MKSVYNRPSWTPKVEEGSRILITGATGGLGRALASMLLEGPVCTIGAHGGSRAFESADNRVLSMQKEFNSSQDCHLIVDEFVEKAGGIDALVVLSGSIRTTGHWKDISGPDFEKEIDNNLNQPFYLAQAALNHMRRQGRGGRIILNGTESALHGGSSVSMPYAIAKRGTECMVQGFAREGAPDNILVNGVRLGYIASGFHQRWHNKTEEDMKARAEMVPLKRGGDPEEAAALIVYLLSGWAGFITGQMIPLTGGDWL